MTLVKGVSKVVLVESVHEANAKVNRIAMDF
jgi:hypothetical protein